jgi:lipopolysaccharide/colanic/teichoic acid biosynthesis glycosyltransferase
MADQGIERITAPPGRDRYALPPAPFLNRRRLCPAAEDLASRVWRRSWSPRVVAGLAAIADILVVSGAGAACAVLAGSNATGVLVATLLASVIGAGTALAFRAAGLYDVRALLLCAAAGVRAGAAWSAVVVTSLLLTLATTGRLAPDPAWWGAFLCAATAALASVRLAAALILGEAMRGGLLERRTVLVGGGAPAQALLRALAAGPAHDVRVLGYFDDRDDTRSPDALPACPKLGNTDDLVEFVRRVPVDLVLFTLPVTAEDRILAMLRKLLMLPVDIRLSAHQSRLRLRSRCYSRVGGIPVVDVADRPVTDWDAVLKGAFDRVVGLVLLALLAPVMLLTAITLRLSGPGPLLVREERYGFNSEVIQVLRFRIPDEVESAEGPPPSRLALRARALAQLIGRTGIASLPQLLTVVFSHSLSLVGPAPHPPLPRSGTECDAVVNGYFARHRVKPGLTGWAQIQAGGSEIDQTSAAQGRIEHDLYYIENWSMLLDLYILAMTPLARLRAGRE